MSAWWFNVISTGGVSDFRSNSGTGVEAKQPEITLQALLRYTSKSFFSVSQRKGYHSGEAYERPGRMTNLYSWERKSLEGPHDAEAMEQSA